MSLRSRPNRLDASSENEGEMDKKMTNMTRRGFLGSSALVLGSLILMPSSALAAPQTDEIVVLEGTSEARARWTEAERRARAENLPIYYGIACGADDSSTIVPTRASYTTVSAQKRETIDGLFSMVTISANYRVTSAKLVDFKWAKIYNSIFDVEESYYDRAILDGGRTTAINFHAVFTTTLNMGHFVGEYYAEFYNTYTGKIF